MATMAPKQLFRSLVREAKKMQDYNFRAYALRRVKAGFQKSKRYQGDEAEAAIVEGMKQLEVLQRQAVLSQLYPSAKSVME